MKYIKFIKYHVGRVIDFVIWKIDCHRYKKIDFFHYEELCRIHKLPEINPYQFNVGYGNAKAIDNILGNGHKIDRRNDYLEHGLWYSDNISVLAWILNIHKVRTIYTFSQFRKDILKKALKERGFNNEIITVGPYILGAESFLGKEKLAELKKQLGKTLLVFPMHSYPGVDNSYDTDSFLNEIDRLSKEFQTILICLAYKDIQRKAYAHFKKKGYTIVSNGCPSDPMFLSRQRDLIELSDVTMSNGMGTHIGYSISLSRPHYFFYQKIESKVSNPSPIELRELQVREELAHKVSSLFGEFSYIITEQQIKFIKSLWGEF